MFINRKKSKGIIRNRFQILALKKEAMRAKKTSRFAKENFISKYDSTPKLQMVEPLVEMVDLKAMEETAPEWVQHFTQCEALVKEIDLIKKSMVQCQNRRLSCIKESEEREIEMEIYNLATKATKKIKQCEKLLEIIRKQAQPESEADQKTCRSVCFKLAVDIQEKAKGIRNQQKAFVEHRKQLAESTKASFLEGAADKMLEDDDYTTLEDETESIEVQNRNAEIIKIVESIHELNDIYKELNALVILQGSLLDRIDYNIDQSYTKVIEANQHLTKAQSRQKSSSRCACGTMVVMLLGILILSIILVVRWSKR